MLLAVMFSGECNAWFLSLRSWVSIAGVKCLYHVLFLQ